MSFTNSSQAKRAGPIASGDINAWKHEEQLAADALAFREEFDQSPLRGNWDRQGTAVVLASGQALNLSSSWLRGTAAIVYTYLTVLNGPRAGSNHLLDDTKLNRVGRGTDCTIVLSDPLCSREHAVIVYEDGVWWLRDLDSRNGTFVSQQKIDEAQLVDECPIRFGSLQFTFRQSEQRPPNVAHPNAALSRTVVLDTPISAEETQIYPPGFPWEESEYSYDFLVIYQLCLRLLGSADSEEVIQVSLDVVREMTGADVAGYLWMSDDGQMRASQASPPEAASKLATSEDLTTSVCGRGRPVWRNDPRSPDLPECLEPLSDAICLPMLHEHSTPRAIHLYKDEDSFDEHQFQFAQSVARIVLAALLRAQQQETLQVKYQRLRDKTGNFDELLGESPAMRQLKSRITRVAQATGSLLIRGESGVGKELVARAVHRMGTRADRPMLSVNCAAIPRELMESQLFGHKRGAFTGADADHTGWFQQADSGTLFLDEVGEMTLEGQAKLLRILDGHPFLPVGGTREMAVDVRVIAATNRDLREFVREKRFREDLYYRLSVFELTIPPLRERGEDIKLLIEHFLAQFTKEHGRPGLTLSPQARQKLLGYNWPGNVRQLRNVIDSAVVMADGESIEPDDLGLRDARDDEFQTLRIDDWERKLIQQALKRTQGNVPSAASLLGIGRATLYRKIEEYQIQR